MIPLNRKKASSKAVEVAATALNLRTGMPFQAHYALLLNAIHPAVSSYIPCDVVKQLKLKVLKPSDTPRVFSLPLPEHFMNSFSAQCMQPRCFFAACEYESPPREQNVPAKNDTAKSSPPSGASVSATPSTQCGSYRPRCGLTGNFFCREELVDLLTCAASEYRFSAPFWIRENHPELTSGYLKLKPTMEPVVICHTAFVFTRDQLEQKSLDALLHPNYKSEKAARPGMNMLTGNVCLNPFLQTMGGTGTFQGVQASGWITLEQLITHKIGLNFSNAVDETKVEKSTKESNEKQKDAKETSPFDVRRILTNAAVGKTSNGAHKEIPSSSFGRLIETDQYSLFNSEQLLVPGRLALERHEVEEGSSPTSLFGD